MPERSPTILILDNDAAVRKLLRRLLERSGYLVRELAGVDDLELRPGQIDLLIADLDSLRQQDVDIVRQLADLHPGMKIIQLSSQPADGAASVSPLVLRKPFHSEALLEMARRALGAADPLKISLHRAAQ